MKTTNNLKFETWNRIILTTGDDPVSKIVVVMTTTTQQKCLLTWTSHKPSTTIVHTRILKSLFIIIFWQASIDQYRFFSWLWIQHQRIEADRRSCDTNHNHQQSVKVVNILNEIVKIIIIMTFFLTVLLRFVHWAQSEPETQTQRIRYILSTNQINVYFKPAFAQGDESGHIRVDTVP